MKLSPLLITISLIAASSSAQSVTLRTLTDVGVHAYVGGGSGKWVARNTLIVGKLDVVAGDYWNWGATMSARATTTAQIAESRGIVTVQVEETGRVSLSANSGSGDCATTGNSSGNSTIYDEPHAFLLTVPTKVGTKYFVRVRYSARTGPGRDAKAWVDLGNDGSDEFLAQGGNGKNAVLSATAATNRLELKIQTFATTKHRSHQLNNTTISMNSTLEVVVEPARCAVTRFGQACGPVLTGSEAPRGSETVLTFATMGAPTLSTFVSVFGVRRLTLPLPGTPGCSLNLEPLVLLGRRSVGFEVTVPAHVQGRVLVQDVVWRFGTISHTTNGLQLDCKSR